MTFNSASVATYHIDRCPILQATSMALTAFPPLNASLSEDKKSLLQHPSHNIGVAMDTSRGLLVPCISAVEEMSVLDIAEVCSLIVVVATVVNCCCCCSLSMVVLVAVLFSVRDASFG